MPKPYVYTLENPTPEYLERIRESSYSPNLTERQGSDPMVSFNDPCEARRFQDFADQQWVRAYLQTSGRCDHPLVRVFTYE